MAYHGVRETVAGQLYRVGLALLDLDEARRDQIVPILNGDPRRSLLRRGERRIAPAFAEAGIVVEADRVPHVGEAVGDDAVRDVLIGARFDLPVNRARQPPGRIGGSTAVRHQHNDGHSC